MYGIGTLPACYFLKGNPAVFILFEARTPGADPGSVRSGIGTPSDGSRVYLRQELE